MALNKKPKSATTTTSRIAVPRPGTKHASVANGNALKLLIAEGVYDKVIDDLVKAALDRQAKVKNVARRPRPVVDDPELADARNNHGQPEEPEVHIDYMETADKFEEQKSLKQSTTTKPAPAIGWGCTDCTQQFPSRKAVFEHRRKSHNAPAPRGRPKPKVPTEDEWKEWTGKAVPILKSSILRSNAQETVNINGKWYERSDFRHKCIRVPQNFSESISGARIIIDGVGPKSVKARFFDKQPARSKYHSASINGDPVWLAHSVLSGCI